MESEYSAPQPINFGTGEMRNSEGNIINCKCGKSAGSATIGKESYIAWCEDCSPYKDAWTAEFVYRPPSEGIK